jgi:predicted nucleotidyltransferase component of viral defense system
MQRTLPEKIEYSNETNIRFAIRGPLYDGSKNSMSRVTINISKRERPISTSMKLLISTFPEIPSFELSVLNIEEIAAEKIRCIMTREKPRDIYDLWFLSKKGITLDVSLINKKLKIYKLTYNQKKFIEKVHEKQKMWKRDLQDLIIGSLPEFDDVLAELVEWSKTW